MRCKQATQMMSERLDGRLGEQETALLEEHLAGCDLCRAEWRAMQKLDLLFSSAPLVQAPLRVRVKVMNRLNRRTQARRALIGGAALTLGTIALAALALLPLAGGLLDAAGVLPALASGGPQTAAQLLAFLGAGSHVLLVTTENFAIPVVFMCLCGLTTALTLNCLWIGAVRHARAAR